MINLFGKEYSNLILFTKEMILLFYWKLDLYDFKNINLLIILEKYFTRKKVFTNLLKEERGQFNFLFKEYDFYKLFKRIFQSTMIFFLQLLFPTKFLLKIIFFLQFLSTKLSPNPIFIKENYFYNFIYKNSSKPILILGKWFLFNFIYENLFPNQYYL